MNIKPKIGMILIICSVHFIVFGLLAWQGVLSFVDLKVLDKIYSPLRRPKISKDILLVKIDKRSEENEAWFPGNWENWTLDDWLPYLTETLNTHELFHDGQPNSIGILLALYSDEEINLDLTGKFVRFADEFQESETGIESLPIGWIPDIPQQVRDIAERAYFINPVTEDGKVRWAQLVTKDEDTGTLEYSLLIHLIKHHLKADTIELDEAANKIILRRGTKSLREIPIDKQGRMVINFASCQTIEDNNLVVDKEFRNISLSDLFHAHERFEAARLSADPAMTEKERRKRIDHYKRTYQNKIVLVDVTTSTPARLQASVGQVLHLLVEANALNTIMEENYPVFVEKKEQIGLLSFLWLLSMMALTICCDRKKPNPISGCLANPSRALLIGGGLCLLYLTFASLIFWIGGVWWGVVCPLLSVGGSSFAAYVFFSFKQGEKQREQLQDSLQENRMQQKQLQKSLQQMQAQRDTLCKTYLKITGKSGEGIESFDFDQIAARLQEYQDELEKRNRERLMQIEHGPHGLKKPLNDIAFQVRVCADKLRRTQTPELALLNQFFSDINTHVDYGLSQIEYMLELAKIEAGEYPLKKIQIPLNYIVKTSVQQFNLEADRKAIDMDMQLSQVPMLKADPEALKRVVENLLSNAIAFTPEQGYITISTHNGANCVEVCVDDTGKGISTDDLEHIFDPYFTTRKSSGLGLSISKGIVELHGGRIKVENRPNGGSRFSFTLPKVDEEEQSESS